MNCKPGDLAVIMQNGIPIVTPGILDRVVEVVRPAVAGEIFHSIALGTSQMLTVTLPYPPSANRYKAPRIVKPKGGPAFISTYVTPEAKAYKEQVAWLCRAAGVKAPIIGRVAIAYTLYPHRPQDWQTRQRKLGDAWQDTVQCIDLDNAQKVLLDALKGIAFEDDAWVRRIVAERAEPDGEARLVVTITAISTKQPQAALFA